MKVPGDPPGRTEWRRVRVAGAQRGGCGGCRGTGKPCSARPACRGDTQPSLSRKLATGLLVKETASVHVGLLSLRSDLGPRAVVRMGARTRTGQS